MPQVPDLPPPRLPYQWFDEQRSPAPVVDHMRRVHTDRREIGGTATDARARQVVLSHLAPADPTQMPEHHGAAAARASARKASYQGRMTVGHDLMHLPLA
ncbi:hypothetical protein [Streptomyces sp. NPDC048425]|uniref:hypothetical protein n=1 Tax=Streptomyces sp. NPDC048425 TaxID=3365548 RepID=UPI0037236054